MTTDLFFAQVLAKIESESIRTWAASAHNRPLVLADIEAYLVKRGEKACAATYAGMLVGIAIGLFG